MTIYVVQPGDTIFSIAEIFGVQAARLILENELNNPYNLVPGQIVVITFPEQTYVVQEGDTLMGIADTYGISLMQLLRNNPFLNGRDYIYPGESLTISYQTQGIIRTNGFAYPYINLEVLKKTLPFLTYLTVFNYTVTADGGITAYEDDTEIIRLAKNYSTIPLMMITTLTTRGEPNLEIALEILENPEIQDRHIENIMKIIKSKGYSGINMIFNYMTVLNQNLYRDLIKKVSDVVKKEGYLFFVTINTQYTFQNNILEFERVDYSQFFHNVDSLILMKFVWGVNTDAPGPISSNFYISEYLKYVIKYVPSELIDIGVPIIGYEWELPYVVGKSYANSLTIDSAISLARDVNATINFDEDSQTAYFRYYQYNFGYPAEYIVWFTDARSVNSVAQLVKEFGLGGTGIWNIMIFYAQMWLVLNSQYDIAKLLPEQTT